MTSSEPDLTQARFPLQLRPHQLAAVAAHQDGPDPDRCHLVLPPGSGKTLIGAEIARRTGRTVLVLVPNTAIQAQWVHLWESLEPAVAVAEDRSMQAQVTVLTYQSLATFDTEADGAEPLAQRLHAEATALLDRISSGPPITLVLDEAHHLAEVWGDVLGELLDRMAGTRPPIVIALTATPRSRLTAEQATLTDRLFGPVSYSVSTPALVRDGMLAPFRELVRFVQPSDAENEYLARHSTRWRELTTSLLEPGFATRDFLPYVDAAWVERSGPSDAPAVSWATVEKRHPDMARAVLRLHAGTGLVSLPQGARLREEHRQPPDVGDWAALIGDYGRAALADSAHEEDRRAWERLRAGLRTVGWTLTRNGVRRGQSPIDKVLQRTVAKADAAAQIVHHEAQVRTDLMRAVIITDFERAAATPQADLRAVLDPEAGSAWEVLGAIEAVDPHLNPVLITGRTVAGSDMAISTLAALAHRRYPRLDLRMEAAPTKPFRVLVGAGWTPRVWLPLATEWFLQGGTQVMIGTRGLLGEGWDAAAVTTLVDLTAATTATSVVQVRGRAIRRDPADPAKGAHIWSVVAVSDEHPRGDADYRRFVAKHDGFHAADPSGRIVLGVSHVSARCGPYRPPDRAERDALNAEMLTVAEDVGDLAELWGVGKPYMGVDLPVTQITVARAQSLDAPEVAVGALRRVRILIPAATAAVCAAILLVAVGSWAAGAAGLIAGAAVGWGLDAGMRKHSRSRLLAELTAQDTLLAMGRAVAAALGVSGPDPVTVHPDGDGVWRAGLNDPADPARSAVFADSLAQLLAPVDWPRYLVSRRLPRGRAEVWHAVPDHFGRNRESAQRFLAGWTQHVSASRLVYTGGAEGAGLLTAVRGLDPGDISTAVRVEWR